MWKLLTGDGPLASRSAFIPHAVSATVLLFAGLLVVGLAQMGGGGSTLPSPRWYYYTNCSSPSVSTTQVANKIGYYTPTTATVTRWRTYTKTQTVTKTVTSYRTRTRTVCRTTTQTVTGPGSTTTETETTTATTTATAPGSTTTVTETVLGPPVSSTID
jgi:hypothetical protein